MDRRESRLGSPCVGALPEFVGLRAPALEGCLIGLLPYDTMRDEDKSKEELIAELEAARAALRERPPSWGAATSLYQGLSSLVPGGVLLLFDTDLRFLVAEGDGLDALGLLKHAVVGHTLAEVFPHGIGQRMEPAYRAVLAGKTVSETFEQGERAYRTRMVPVRNRHHDVVAGLMIIQDVTPQKQADAWATRTEGRRLVDAASREIRHLEQVALAAFEAISFGTCVIDAAGEIVHINDALSTLCGRRTDELLGTPFVRLIPEAQRPDAARRCETFVHGGTTSYAEWVVEYPDGQAKAVTVVAAPLRVSGRRYAVLTCFDAQEQEQVGLSLQQAREVMEEMGQLKTTFLSNISHEIRTPLTSIIGFAEILEGDLQSEQCEFARLIGRSGRRLMETFNAVLDLAQLEAQSLHLIPQPVPICQAVQEVVQPWYAVAASQDLTLRLEADVQDETIYLDPAYVGRVLNNLIDNAIKFTDAGEVVLRVALTPQRVELTVADTGIGIGADFLPYLFDQFAQESTGMARSHEGSGLGLYLAHRLVEMMGGTITVESQKGVGSTFHVSLPRRHPSVAVPAAPTVPASTDEAPPAAAAAPVVLVLEDNPETSTMLHHILNGGYEVHLTTAVEDALEVVDTHDVEVALVDINLGHALTGIDFCRIVNDDAEKRRPKLIAMTAYALPGDRLDLLQAGFDDYLAKPFTVDQLRELLNGVTRRSVDSG